MMLSSAPHILLFIASYLSMLDCTSVLHSPVPTSIVPHITTNLHLPVLYSTPGIVRLRGSHMGPWSQFWDMPKPCTLWAPKMKSACLDPSHMLGVTFPKTQWQENKIQCNIPTKIVKFEQMAMGYVALKIFWEIQQKCIANFLSGNGIKYIKSIKDTLQLFID